MLEKKPSAYLHEYEASIENLLRNNLNTEVFTIKKSQGQYSRINCFLVYGLDKKNKKKTLIKRSLTLQKRFGRGNYYP